ncbi:dual specificity protein phosphatase 21 [Lepeophtheirus salmonis]|nr:dual specificity protein phosphatase 21-like [Lepeophtheirus salmonis]
MSIFTEFSEVTKDLYLSSAFAIKDEVLKEHDIYLVINATKELPLWPPSGPPVFDVIRVPLVDSSIQDAYKYFEDVSNLIKKHSEDSKKTLIHCAAGVSRSACLAVAYLMRHHNMPLEEALTKLKMVRPAVKPNNGFVHQLTRWQDECNKLRAGDERIEH